MSNLIPTPIVDKNGVASTRNKKPVRHTDASGIPAPHIGAGTGTSSGSDGAVVTGDSGANFFTRWQDRRRQKKADEVALVERNVAVEELVGELFLGGTKQHAGTTREGLVSSLSVLSTEEINIATGLARLVTRAGVSKDDADRDRKSIIWSLGTSASKEDQSNIEVRALNAHADWLRSHPGEAEKLRKTIDNLIGLDMVANGGDDGIEHLDEYMAASLHPAFDSYDIIFIWRKDFMNAVVRYPENVDDIVTYIKSRRGFVEEGFDSFIRVADEYPERIEKMRSYMSERGTFDEEGFEQYVNAASPLAEGAL